MFKSIAFLLVSVQTAYFYFPASPLLALLITKTRVNADILPFLSSQFLQRCCNPVTSPFTTSDGVANIKAGGSGCLIQEQKVETCALPLADRGLPPLFPTKKSSLNACLEPCVHILEAQRLCWAWGSVYYI